MISKIFKNVSGAKSNDIRTIQTQKNIIYSFGIKGVGILISFVLVPLTLNYLNAGEYGIWLTLSSLMTWINYFDIGLTNGLRNQLAEALTLKNYQYGKIYISTTFALLTIIVLVFILFFTLINPLLDWNRILNVNSSSNTNFNYVVLIVFVFFCLQFVFKTVGTVLIADQKSALNDLIGVIGNLIALIIIYILTKITTGNLTLVAITFSATPLIVLVLSYFILFFGKYTYLRPSFSLINFKYTKNLIGIGLQFFIIQISVCVVAYTSTNIIIAQVLNNESVTTYNIAFRYFFALSMVYQIIITPYWSAATDAYVKQDFQWMRKSIKRLVVVYVLSLITLFFMLLLSKWFYLKWVGKSIQIPFLLSLSVAFYVAMYNWSTTFIYFINGIGKIRLQLVITILVAILYIPLAVLMGKTLGLNGIILTSTIALIPVSVLMPIQLRKLIHNKAKGIWFK